MSHFNIMDSGTINSETNCPCQWILTNQWELIFNPDQEHTEINTADLSRLFDNDLWRFNVQSVIFNKNIHLSYNNDHHTNWFYNYKSLKSADLQNLDFKDCTNLSYFFYNCVSLDTVLFPNTEFGNNIENLDFMFFHCTHLRTIDLSNLNPYFVNSMDSAFSDCYELTFLDLSNIYLGFNINLDNMCANCTQLQECFLPSTVIINKFNLYRSFSNCTHLKSIDLTRLNFSAVFDPKINMQNCFENCISLKHVQFFEIEHNNPTIIHSMNYLNDEHPFSLLNMFLNCSNLHTFKTKAKIPYEILNKMQLPFPAILSYFEQFNKNELSEYLDCYTPYPSLKSELMNIINLINFDSFNT